MKSSKKHICNRVGTGFLFCLPLDRALRALHCEHLTPTLEIVPLGWSPSEGRPLFSEQMKLCTWALAKVAE